MSQLLQKGLFQVAPLMPITWWSKAASSLNVIMCLCLCLLSELMFFSSLAFGNCNGLAVVDYLQKTVLLCMSTLDVYGTTDPYQRLTRSPRRNRQSTSGSSATNLYGPTTHTCTYWLSCTCHKRLLHLPVPVFWSCIFAVSVFCFFFPFFICIFSSFKG